MKQQKSRAVPQMKSERLVFFDILRILFVALIVYNHFKFLPILSLNNFFSKDGYSLFNLYPNSPGILALYGMIFVSGAVIQYSYNKIRSRKEYEQFIAKRFIRLYPAYWMSLIFGIILLPWVFLSNPLGSLFEFTGFFAFLGTGSGIINQMGWFIGAIFSLYLLFPLISQALGKYGIKALILFMIIGFGSRLFFFTYNPLNLYDTFLWFPLCNLFEFGLGIYIIQKHFYPAMKGDYPLIRELSELSFYVFLFHVVILKYVATTVVTADFAQIYYFIIFLAIILVSWIAMVLDRRLQKMITTFARAKKWIS